MNIFKKIYNFYKHTVDLYGTKPVTRKEYLIVLAIFLLINLLSYALLDNDIILVLFVILVLFAPLLLIATFNRLKNTIISSTPAFILSFLIPYLLLVLYVSTIGLEMNIPLENYIRNTAIVYFILLFLSGLILPVSNKEITYEKEDEDNKKLNLLHIFNDLITLNLKASINRLEYAISCIFAAILPASMAYLSYLLVIMLRPFYRYSLGAVNDSSDPAFAFIIMSYIACFLVTIFLFFLLFILRLNDITKNFTVKLSIITAYIILFTAGLVMVMQIDIVLILVFTILLFVIPAFIKVKVIDENKALKINN